MIEATNIMVFICHCEPVKSHPEYGKVHHIIAHVMVNDLNPVSADSKMRSHLMDSGLDLQSVEIAVETTPLRLLSLDALTIQDYYLALKTGIAMRLTSVASTPVDHDKSDNRTWVSPNNQNQTKH